MMMSETGALPYRYAVYFSPALESPLGAAGRHWLGRCAVSGDHLDPPSVPGLSSQEHQSCLADPRRYGWHATLKPPFALQEGSGLADIRNALQRLAARFEAVELPALQVCDLGGFIALRPGYESKKLQELAAACVTELHPLARPLDAGELARRRRAPLTAEQDQLLLRWGYPWVLQQFRFHFSLTGPLGKVDAAIREALFQSARRHFDGLPPCLLDRIALFVEPVKGADFRWVEDVLLRR